jgi:ribosomal protein S18 acetylase RimI-like enzyme
LGAIDIRPLTASPDVQSALSDILIETVANGGSVSFMHPVARHDADAFWSAALDAAGADKRIILGAWDGSLLAGSVTLLLDLPPNQPHRAEIAKLMVRVNHRGRGIAAALMQAAEAAAITQGRTLLVLDTATIGGAAGLYEKLGYAFTGEIPDYALLPHGGLTGTLLYWKRIGKWRDGG